MSQQKVKKTEIFKAQKKAFMECVAQLLRDKIEDDDVNVEIIAAQDVIKPTILVTKINDEGEECEQWAIDIIRKTKILKYGVDYEESETALVEKNKK